MNRRAWTLGAAMVLFCNLVAVALRAYAEAAFIEAYGRESLPWLFVATAGGFAIATLGYDTASTRLHARTVDFGLVVALGIAAGVAPSLLAAGVPPVVFVVALAAVSQVAGLALWNRVCASVAGRDARRMLPRAGACVTAGGAIAGLFSAALVIRVGLDILPYLGAAMMVIVLGLAIAQDRALATGGSPGLVAPPGTPEGLNRNNQRLLASMIALALLEGVIATVIDLQFAAELKSRYTGDSLAVALLLFYGGTNGVLLLLQVTAVPRILVTRSLPTTTAIHPMLVGLGYLVFFAAPGLVTIALTRTSDQVFRLATSRTAQEVSLSSFPPTPRARWKVLLRGAISPAGAALAALALLAIGPGVFRHPAILAGAGCAIALVWFVVGQVSARRFQTALAAPLGIQTNVKVDDPTRIDLVTLERWTRAAGIDDPRTAALARAALSRARVVAADLGDHLRHDETAVRAALFDQLARAPSPALRNELRAAVMIEDDDRAFALGLKALALAGDDGVLERGKERAALSREVAQVVRSAERTLRGGPELETEVATLCDRDPQWAAALIRRHRDALDEPTLARILLDATREADRRANALAVIARVGPPAALPALVKALETVDSRATSAIAELDDAGAAYLGDHLDHFTPLAKLAMARALAGAPSGASLVRRLLADADAEVAHAALRTALAVARGGGQLRASEITTANKTALAALVAHLDARDVVAHVAKREAEAEQPAPSPSVSSPGELASLPASTFEIPANPPVAIDHVLPSPAPSVPRWSAFARAELDLAIRSCVARLLWAVAVEAAASGRDAAAFAATARRLIAGREPDRRRALDVVQELQAGNATILEVLERWLRPPVPREPDARGGTGELARFDPWLASLAAGELAPQEPLLAALRRPALFATVPGPSLAALCQRARKLTVDGVLFAEGSTGDTMYIVVEGTLVARRAHIPDRDIVAGGVVGELAVLTRAPRAATVVSRGVAAVLEIDRESFSAASRRSPELVLGLSATLAGWLGQNRPDVL